MTTIDIIEAQRLKIQSQLDLAKTQSERNKQGQFATPTALATEILAYAKSLLPPDLKLRFLDPAIGTGSFISALLRSFPLGCHPESCVKGK
jgi:adenine-specific DNA-methyltransferase